MDLLDLAEQERGSKSYALNFFSEEKEMGGIFKSDTAILDSLLSRKGRLLDAAMGPGRHVRHFAGRGFEVWGNDFNMHMINEAKKYVGNRSVKYTNHDMRSLNSIKSGYFDYVICMGASLGSVYRASGRQKVVHELSRVARKGGLVAIHAHNLLELSCFMDVANAFKNRLLHPKQYELGDVVYEHGGAFRLAYMHWFTPHELRSLMRNAGLRVEKEFYLKGPDQDAILPGKSPLKSFRAGGFVFVGRKV